MVKHDFVFELNSKVELLSRPLRKKKGGARLLNFTQQAAKMHS